MELDDPIYEHLAKLYAASKLPPYVGGMRPLSEARVEDLLVLAGETVPERFGQAETWWVSPTRRVALRANLFREHNRTYSTLLRPRDVVGGLAVSCEHREGRPCGNGAAISSDLEGAAGYGRFASLVLRLRPIAGTDEYVSTVELDRLYLNGEVGPVGYEIGRDTFVLGPSVRTQLGWGDHAPPLDHVRVSTARPVAIIPALRVNAQYVLGRLRAPQTYPGNLVSIVRGQLDIVDSVEVGVMQMLQLVGDGAPGMDLGDFILEHVRRRDRSASASDSSNRRFGGDFSARISGLAGARFYYVVMFEDIRAARLVDAIRYDADHLLGIELAAIGPERRHGLVVEWHQTGVRSQEHSPRVTGFTNAGRIVGSPLGPDGQSWFARGRVELGWGTVYPWLELAMLSSDAYEFVPFGPINRTVNGVTETRVRAGARLRVVLDPGWWVEGEALYEHVDAFAFEPGSSRDNVGVVATMVWHPTGVLGRLAAD